MNFGSFRRFGVHFQGGGAVCLSVGWWIFCFQWVSRRLVVMTKHNLSKMAAVGLTHKKVVGLTHKKVIQMRQNDTTGNSPTKCMSTVFMKEC